MLMLVVERILCNIDGRKEKSRLIVTYTAIAVYSHMTNICNVMQRCKKGNKWYLVGIVFFCFFFTNKTLKSVSCICVQPPLAWHPKIKSSESYSTQSCCTFFHILTTPATHSCKTGATYIAFYNYFFLKHFWLLNIISYWRRRTKD